MHILNRNRSSQDITEVKDVMSKESFNKVKIRLSDINKHVSDGINKDRENQKQGAKEFSKAEAEFVDVMDTFQHAISITEKEIAKNLAFLQKEIDTRNTNSMRTALIRGKTSRSIAFSKQCS